MILLDTDHLSVFTDARNPRHELLNSRMEAAAEQVKTGCRGRMPPEKGRQPISLIHHKIGSRPLSAVLLGEVEEIQGLHGPEGRVGAGGGYAPPAGSARILE